MIKVLEHNNPEPEVKCRLLQSAVDIVGGRARESKSLKFRGFMEIHAFVLDVWESNQKLAQQFLGQLTHCE